MFSLATKKKSNWTVQLIKSTSITKQLLKINKILIKILLLGPVGEVQLCDKVLLFKKDGWSTIINRLSSNTYTLHIHNYILYIYIYICIYVYIHMVYRLIVWKIDMYDLENGDSLFFVFSIFFLITVTKNS